MAKHQALINQLKPLLHLSDFTSHFELLTQDIPHSERYMLKMELYRLNQTSTQSLDMRDRINGHCEEVELGGVTHYLTRPLQRQLLELMEPYNNRLTVGAVEELLENMRRPQGLQPGLDMDEKTLLLGHMEMLALGHYVMRKELRSTFTTQVSLWQNPNQKHDGLTLDLSIGGCKIRIDKDVHLAAEHPVFISFTDLSHEFLVPNLSSGLKYQMIDVNTRRGYQYVRLQRINANEAQDTELTQVLQANSLRTTPELNHLYGTIRSRSYERLMLPNLELISLGFQLQQQTLKPLIAIQTQHNQVHHLYWQNEHNISQLPEALSFKRLQALRLEPQNSTHGLLYAFHIQQGQQKLFFSATLAELMRTGLMNAFLNFASKQESFRVFQLACFDITDSDMRGAMYNPLQGTKFEPLVRQQLNTLNLLAIIQPLPCDPTVYQQRAAGEDLNTLRQFGMVRNNHPTISTLASVHSDLRREPRFNLRTTVRIKKGFLTVQEGQTVNLSAHGVKMAFDDPHSFFIGQIIELEYPQLQQLANKVKLAGIPYEVVGINPDKTILRLQSVTGVFHKGLQFIGQLLEERSGDVTQSSNSAHHRQLGETIKNITLPRLPSLAFFVHKHHAEYQANLLGCSDLKQPLLSKLNPKSDNPADLSWLMQHPIINKVMPTLRKLTMAEPIQLRLAIALPTAELPANILLIDETAQAELRPFVLKALAQRRFLGLQVSFYKSGKPDIDQLRYDLLTLNGQASHRTRQLELMLKQVAAVGYFEDFSTELLCRLNLESLTTTHF